jgi:hypothetical protein
VFDQAAHRDPGHRRPWIVLVDGARHQLDLIETEAARRKASVHILIDLIHALEYLWSAAWCLHENGDPAAEAFVARHARLILAGHSQTGADDLERAARAARLRKPRRKGIDDAVGYLRNKAAYLRYDTALERGWPIATGVIEGACRHLVKTDSTSPAPAGALPAPKPSSNSGPCALTATSIPTGPGTRSRNTPATTKPATRPSSYRLPDQQHPHIAAPNLN